MLRFLNIALLIVTLLSVQACDSASSGSFFEDPPACYYDSLFGCGTFDIPSNSSYYGHNRSYLRAGGSQAVSAVLQSSVSRKASTCRFKAPDKINGKFEYKQVNNIVSLKLPVDKKRKITLRGKKSRKGFSVTGTGVVSVCRYSAKGDFNARNKKSYGINLNIRLSCILQKPCSVSYRGQAYK